MHIPHSNAIFHNKCFICSVCKAFSYDLFFSRVQKKLLCEDHFSEMDEEVGLLIENEEKRNSYKEDKLENNHHNSVNNHTNNDRNSNDSSRLRRSSQSVPEISHSDVDGGRQRNGKHSPDVKRRSNPGKFLHFINNFITYTLSILTVSPANATDNNRKSNGIAEAIAPSRPRDVAARSLPPSPTIGILYLVWIPNSPSFFKHINILQNDSQFPQHQLKSNLLPSPLH
jgi:hypothetical protein